MPCPGLSVGCKREYFIHHQSPFILPQSEINFGPSKTVITVAAYVPWEISMERVSYEYINLEYPTGEPVGALAPVL